eukprot:g2065.t1
MRNDRRNQSPRLEAENNQKLVQENAKLKEEIALLKRERERNPGQARIEERLGSAGSSGHFQKPGYNPTMTRGNNGRADSSKDVDISGHRPGNERHAMPGKKNQTMMQPPRVSNLRGNKATHFRRVEGSATKDEITRKRQELVESPNSKLQFKEFQKMLKQKDGYKAAKMFVDQMLDRIPVKVHWRAQLELADRAKRENFFREARDAYQRVHVMQPYAHQGWLEHAKMEEECGNLVQCSLILEDGLYHCPHNENLLMKAIKHEERCGNKEKARQWIASVKDLPIEKTWQTTLQGALFEARDGKTEVARRCFRFLIEHVQWYGPIYFEAARFEERNEEYARALKIIRRGLSEHPRYGPLWFVCFRIHETNDTRESLRLLRMSTKVNTFHEGDTATLTLLLRETYEALINATRHISKELMWKVFFEKAQVHDRAADLVTFYEKIATIEKYDLRISLLKPIPQRPSQESAASQGPLPMSKTHEVHTCTAKEAVKIFLEQARTEYANSIVYCPQNLRWKIWLAGARTELGLGGNEAAARHLLKQAMVDVPAKSRSQVLLECARIEEFYGHTQRARDLLRLSRKSTRHDWKIFLESVLLEFRCGNNEQAITLAKLGLKIHPGTGRLWAILIQLMYERGSEEQFEVLRSALDEVPKSGEVWCEAARLHMQPFSEHFDLERAKKYLDFSVQFTPQYGDSFLELMRLRMLKKMMKVVEATRGEMGEVCSLYDVIQATVELWKRDGRHLLREIKLDDVRRRCLNADPNYGTIWFYCKRQPFEPARRVLNLARELIEGEMATEKVAKIYIAAIALRQLSTAREGTTVSKMVDIGTMRPGDFTTGLVSVTRSLVSNRIKILTDRERRKLLYGSDHIHV